MSTKSYIITLSIAGTAAALSYLMFAGDNAQPAPAARPSSPAGVARSALWETDAPRAAKVAEPGEQTAAASKARSARIPFPAQDDSAEPPLTPEARAAKVEQEANHELRRLVTLLNLDEAQQDKVFQTLARNSRHWSPDMQFAPATGAGASGKPSQTTPGLYVPGTDTPAKTAPIESAPPSDAVAAPDSAKTSDPLEEIMAILDPEQQTELIKDEMDRAAWWAEILPQILPPDEVPGLDGGTPSSGPGEVREYEGSEVLE